MKKKLGIVGGMGPLAGAHFLELLTNVTDVPVDQEHIDAILYSSASVPDRTAYILGNSTVSPVPPIVEALRSLEALGVSNIAIACVTTHYFFDEFAASVQTPILNMPELTAAFIKDRGYKKAGILATSGTIQTKLFQSKLGEIGVGWAIPQDHDQALAMDIIYGQIKANKPYDQAMFSKIVDNLCGDGCDCVVLGCTELSLVKRDFERTETLGKLSIPLADALEVLAVHSALASGVPVKHRNLEL